MSVRRTTQAQSGISRWHDQREKRVGSVLLLFFESPDELEARDEDDREDHDPDDTDHCLQSQSH